MGMQGTTFNKFASIGPPWMPLNKDVLVFSLSFPTIMPVGFGYVRGQTNLETLRVLNAERHAFVDAGSISERKWFLTSLTLCMARHVHPAAKSTCT